QTANELAEDLRRFLADRPILARRTSTWEQTRRWCRRNPLSAALAIATLSLLLVVAVGSTISAVMLNSARLRAQEAERDAKLEVGRSLVAQATANLNTGLAGRRFESLGLLKRAAGVFRADPRGLALLPETRDQAICSLGLTDLKQIWSRPLEPAIYVA